MTKVKDMTTKQLIQDQLDEDDEPKEVILESFKQALLEIGRGETIPLAQLWEGIN